VTHYQSVVRSVHRSNHLLSYNKILIKKFIIQIKEQTKITMARNKLQSSLVVVCFAIFAVSVYGELCRKFDKPENPTCDRKFCPLERLVDGIDCEKCIPNKCISNKFQYKCGVFYKNLPGRVNPDGSFEPLTFIGALPDVLNKPKIQNSAEIRETFGDLKRKQFSIPSVCKGSNGPTVGNARCYAAMSKASKINLDQCTKTIVNEDGKETIGDVLCETIDTFYENGYFNTNTAPDSLDNIEIGFQYSVCGGPWTQVANNETRNGIETSTPLEAPEKLCCSREAGKLRFRRCDGSPFNSVCNG